MDLFEESDRGWMMLFLVSNPKFTGRKDKEKCKRMSKIIFSSS